MTQPCSHWCSLNKVICLLQTIHLVSIKHQQSTTVIAMSIRRKFSRGGGETIYTTGKSQQFLESHSDRTRIKYFAILSTFWCHNCRVSGGIPASMPARTTQTSVTSGVRLGCYWHTRTGGTTLHYCVWQKVMDDDEAITSYKHQHYCLVFFIWFAKPHQQLTEIFI